MYDYLLVGAGLFNATLASLIKKNNKNAKVLVLEKRSHIAGNIYTKNIEGIDVHIYGAHIFHTSDKTVWQYVNNYAEFNRYTNSPIAYYKGEVYNLPFNMNTFSKMWGISKAEEAKKIIDEQRREICAEPKNLEEQAISLVGRDIYEKLIKGYTEKQWGRDCKDLPAFIIKRLPVRFVYDNNYFNDMYQGIPIEGYTKMIENMFDGCDIDFNVDYLQNKDKYSAKTIIYTGMIDEYFGFSLGTLEYRSLRFDIETLDQEDYQSNAVVNYTEREVPFTRIIEHKYFTNVKTEKTIITKEYPTDWQKGMEAYYPINDEININLYNKYVELANKENIIFAGRLGQYKYFDMDKTMLSAMEIYDKIK